MIRVIIERDISKGCMDDYLELIRRARRKANKVEGFIAGELLQEKDNQHHAVIISSWENIESWDTWFDSEERQKVLTDMRPFLNADETILVLENSHVLN